MIICVCNRLRDKELKDACESCPRNSDAENLFSELGCKPVCGQCICYIEEVLLPQTS